MPSLWDAGAADALITRARLLTPDRRAQWGKLSCPQMVAHVTDACRLYLGEIATAPKAASLIRYPPFKQVIVYVLPFPKHVPTAPELLARPPGEWHADLDDLCQAITRCAASRGRSAWPFHPIFGHLSPRAWGVLAWRHTDHHLRQFGV